MSGAPEPVGTLEVALNHAAKLNIATSTIPAMKALVDNPEKLLESAPYLEATFGLLP